MYLILGGGRALTAPPVAAVAATATAEDARYHARATPADLITLVFAAGCLVAASVQRGVRVLGAGALILLQEFIGVVETHRHTRIMSNVSLGKHTRTAVCRMLLMKLQRAR